MPICKKCSTKFPSSKKIDGKWFVLNKRSYCTDCSPIGTRRFCGPKPADGVALMGREIERKCKKCGNQFKTKNAFNFCRRCQAAKIRESRKGAAVKMLGGKCIICGYDKCLTALDFHHINPEDKSGSVSFLSTRKSSDFFIEVKKCCLLCCRCHREVHEGITILPPHSAMASQAPYEGEIVPVQVGGGAPIL